MSFLTKAASILGKMKNNLSQPDGQSTVSSGLSILAKMGKAKLILMLTPVISIIFILLVVSVAFANDLEQVQMNDPNAGEQAETTSGNIVYTEADFEDAVKVSNSASIAYSTSEFGSHLSGTEYKDLAGFNARIKANVKKAGWGTREGVVAAAMTFAYEYPKATGYKYFYTNNFDITMRTGHEGIIDGSTYLDCRAFVQWAVYNGGFYANELNYIGTYGVAKIGTVKSDVTKVQPGDIFSTPSTGHIWIVVGVTSDGYYAAEEYGYGNGLVVNKYTFDNAYNGYGASLYDMSGYYNNKSNVRPE